MADSRPYAVKMSQEEVLLISLKLRLPLMMGLDEKMLALSKEDLQSILESAERMLLARDFLRADKDGSMRLAPILMAVVFTCAKPKRR